MGRQAGRRAQDPARQGRGGGEAGPSLRRRGRDLQGTGGAAAGLLRRGRVVVRGAARRGGSRCRTARRRRRGRYDGKEGQRGRCRLRDRGRRQEEVTPSKRTKTAMPVRTRDWL